MTNNIQNKIYAIEDQSRPIFFTLTTGVIVGFCIYLLLLAGTFMGGVERQELARQANVLHSQIQTLEAKYMSLNNNIDANFAASQGFVSVNSTEYISLNSAQTPGLTLNR